jgi:ribonuclease-3
LFLPFKEIEDFLKTVKWPVQNFALYREALTHSSYAYETQDIKNNERMEYLGDAVLELVISEYFFRAFPDYSEGKLTLMRHRVVNEKSLASIARGLKLGLYLKLGKGEILSGGPEKSSLLADALEALVGALFLDHGYSKAKELIIALFSPVLKAVGEGILPHTDFKTIFQEKCQSALGKTPVYEIVRECGPPHDRTFDAIVKIEDRVVGRGTGKSKKEAEQSAANDAWKNYSENKNL